jgi:diaminohydroxyphosphoribosylaminopyrimidine deaminase/5-amino-6-(5-phosphoribosylamino)uracil reductase
VSLPKALHVTLKLATSLDGRIATAGGDSKWITGEAAREQGRRLRAAHDAVLIGSGTALQDDPELTVRIAGESRQPLRVVLDTRFRLPPQARLLRTVAQGPVLVIGGEAGAAGAAALQAAGAAVAHAPLQRGRLDITAVLEILAGRGVSRLLVEGGGEAAASFVRAECVQALEWFRAPMLLGGDARPALAALALARLAQAPRLRRIGVQALGPDLWERYVWERPSA